MLYIPFPFKRCSRCTLYFPATLVYFSPRRNKVDNLNAKCRVCLRFTQRATYHKYGDKYRAKSNEKYRRNPQRTRVQSKQWRKDHPEEYKKQLKGWNEAHPEMVRIYAQRRRDKDPDKVRAYMRDWKKKNRTKVQQYEWQRRARKKNAPANFTADHWRYAIDYFNGTCAYCGNPPKLWDSPRILQQDHFIPVGQGGGYTPGNIVPACQGCNTSKNDSDPIEWVEQHFGPRRAKTILARIQDYFAHV